MILENTELPTAVVSSREIRAFAGSDLLQGPIEAELIVRNQDPAGHFVDSDPAVFTIGNTPPRLVELSGVPTPLLAGAAGFTLTVKGFGFIPGASVLVEGASRPTTFVSDTELRASIPAEDLRVGGQRLITVVNPGPAVRSNAVAMNVFHQVPTITGLSPGSGEVQLSLDQAATRVQVVGSGFEESASVLVDGMAVPTSWVSGSELLADVPASLLVASGIRQVQVRNPEPSLATSFGYPLFLSNPAPVLGSIVGSATFDRARSNEILTVPVVLTGNNFARETTVWASLPCDKFGFRRIAATRLGPTMFLASVTIWCGGDYRFQVRSPQPGGGVSKTISLTVPEG